MLGGLGSFSGPSSGARGLQRERCRCAGDSRGTKVRVEGENVFHGAEQRGLEAGWGGGNTLCTKDNLGSLGGGLVCVGG